ncbi:hypothetical protein GCM10023152_12340 [Agromyces bauzanensis]|uniref:Uncharacterized protein n=1 Tax=Agromyces bauzanensis TaxID=1308924 RepID=A0A917ULQ1_9MICO|nr:hypothetical protein GCM10011372_00590 [Agromyces bauzanensis]
MTEPSSKASWSHRFSSGIGSVSVTTTESMNSLQDLGRRIGEDRVGRRDHDADRTIGLEYLDGSDDRAARVDHVVDEQAYPALDSTDDLLHADPVGHQRVACG